MKNKLFTVAMEELEVDAAVEEVKASDMENADELVLKVEADEKAEQEEAAKAEEETPVETPEETPPAEGSTEEPAAAPTDEAVEAEATEVSDPATSDEEMVATERMIAAENYSILISRAFETIDGLTDIADKLESYEDLGGMSEAAAPVIEQSIGIMYASEGISIENLRGKFSSTDFKSVRAREAISKEAISDIKDKVAKIIKAIFEAITKMINWFKEAYYAIKNSDEKILQNHEKYSRVYEVLSARNLPDSTSEFTNTTFYTLISDKAKTSSTDIVNGIAVFESFVDSIHSELAFDTNNCKNVIKNFIELMVDKDPNDFHFAAAIDYCQFTKMKMFNIDKINVFDSSKTVKLSSGHSTLTSGSVAGGKVLYGSAKDDPQSTTEMDLNKLKLDTSVKFTNQPSGKVSCLAFGDIKKALASVTDCHKKSLEIMKTCDEWSSIISEFTKVSERITNHQGKEDSVMGPSNVQVKAKTFALLLKKITEIYLAPLNSLLRANSDYMKAMNHLILHSLRDYSNADK